MPANFSVLYDRRSMKITSNSYSTACKKSCHAAFPDNAHKHQKKPPPAIADRGLAYTAYICFYITPLK